MSLRANYAPLKQDPSECFAQCPVNYDLVQSAWRTSVIPGPGWASVTVPSNPFRCFFPWPVPVPFPQVWEKDPLWIFGVLSLCGSPLSSTCPVNSSCLGLPRFSSAFSTQRVFWDWPVFLLLALWPGNSLKAAKQAGNLSHLFVVF